MESDEPTPKRARPAETSTTGRKRTRSGSLAPSFPYTPVANVPALEAPIDRLLQEVQGGVVVLRPSTPHSSLKLAPRRVETGLAPLLEVIQGDNVIEESMVVVSPSLPPGAIERALLALSAQCECLLLLPFPALPLNNIPISQALSSPFEAFFVIEQDLAMSTAFESAAGSF